MEIKKEILRLIDIRRKKLLAGINSAKLARDMAPSAMESHSDTTKSEKEKLIDALEGELKQLDKTISDFEDNLKRTIKGSKISIWKYVEIVLGDKKMKLLIVPEGLGGESIKDIKLLANKSPLGLVILNLKKGAEFEFNGVDGKVEDIQNTI